MGSFWVTIACLTAAYWGFHRLLAWRHLSHVPGPASAAWSDLWLIRRTWSGDLFHELGEVSARYGPLARIAPNYVVCGDPVEVRRIWAARSGFDRAPWYKGFRLDPPHDCTLSVRDSNLHTALRSKMAAGYRGNDVDGVHESIDECVARFVQLIEDKYLSTTSEHRPVDFARKVQYLTLDVISTIAFGEAFGFIGHDADFFDYIKTTEDTVPVMQLCALVPWLVKLLQSPIGKLIMPTEKDPVGLGPIMATAKRVVGRRYGEKPIKRRDMLGSFVEHGIDQREAESESLVQIIAGSDTTATALRTIMLHVIATPDVYNRLPAEIDAALRDGRASSPITDAEARRLPFLQACIKEGLRMWPPVSGVIPKVSETDSTVCGLHIPAGTNVAWSARACLRDRDIFAADSNAYRPDRWLLAGEEQYRSMDQAADLAFGVGKWGCLGRPIALIELNKMITELFRRFDFAIVNPEKPIKNSFHGVLIQSEFYLRISRRVGG